MKLRVWAVPMVAALLLLTGCDQLAPGTASVVNGAKITDDEVQDVADAQCVAADAAAKAGGGTATALSRIHQQSLFLLIDAEISKQYAEEEGLEASKGLADAFFSEFKDSLAALPEKPRTVLEEPVHGLGREPRRARRGRAARRPASRRARRTSSSCSTPGCRSARSG